MMLNCPQHAPKGHRPPWRGFAAVAFAAVLAGCAQATGDFGRYEPDIVHDKVMPLLGDGIARARHEAVSPFPLTDNENAMRALARGITDPPSEDDWLARSKAELQRTRISPPADSSDDMSAYSRLLLSAAYASSETRYNRVAGDIASDRSSIAPFYAAARQVRADDQMRFAALGRPANLKPDDLAGAYARVDENNKVMAWVWRALRFRLKAYRHGIEELAIATPSAQGAAADTAAAAQLEADINAADAGTAAFDPGALVPKPAGRQPKVPWHQGKAPLDPDPFEK